MAMSAALFIHTTLNIFLLCFSFPSFTPFNFSCSLRADSVKVPGTFTQIEFIVSAALYSYSFLIAPVLFQNF